VSQTIPSISKEYARVDVTADVELGAQSISFVFLPKVSPDTEPTGGDPWVTATWLGSAGTTRTAGVLVGPGATVLPEGDYRIWWKLTAAPEVPFRMAGGTLTIT